MSGSPKYNYVNGNQERQERAERERRAREQRRREEEQRARRAALEAVRKKAVSRISSLTARGASLAASGVAATITASLQRANTMIQQAQDTAGVEAGLRAAAAAEQEMLRERGRLAAQRVATAERIDELARVVSELDDRRRLDPAGTKEIDTLVDNARRAVFADPAGADRLVAQLGSRVQAHVTAVTSAREQEEARRVQAEQAVAELAARYSALATEADSVDVDLAANTQAAPAIRAIEEAVSSGRITEALAEMDAVRTDLDGVEQSLDQTIRLADERRDLMRTLIEALPDLGYIPDATSYVETADGAIGVMAATEAGDDLRIIVQGAEDGTIKVEYATAEMIEQASVGGGAACTDLLDIVEQLREKTASQGFESSEVGWAARTVEPRRPLREAKPLKTRGAGQ